MNKSLTAVIALLFCLNICAGQIFLNSNASQVENISKNSDDKIELRRNFHINFINRDDKAGKMLYQRQLMEFATSPVQVPLKWYWEGKMPTQ